MRTSKKRALVFLWAFIAILIFLSFYFDSDIVKFVTSMRTSALTGFFTAITFIGPVLVFLFLTLLFMKKSRRRWLIPLWATLIISEVVSFLLKIAIQRQRPFQLGLVSIISGLQEAAFSTWDFSFPSGHAIIVFAALPFLSKEFPKLKYLWIVFACLVAFSRVYLGLHFLSDVILGAVIGYLIGFVVLSKWEEKF
jgi:undecaprenyl-diphosphatase